MSDYYNNTDDNGELLLVIKDARDNHEKSNGETSLLDCVIESLTHHEIDMEELINEIDNPVFSSFFEKLRDDAIANKNVILIDSEKAEIVRDAW